MMELLAHDTSLWVGISFAMFAFVAYKMGGKAITRGLDAKIDEVKQEVETAERLRVEAQELLAQYERKQRDAEKEAKTIIDNAKNQAIQLQENAEKDLEDLMQRRETQLKERLKRVEESAIAEVQSHAADLVVQATTEALQNSLDAKSAKALSENTIASVSKHLN